MIETFDTRFPEGRSQAFAASEKMGEKKKAVIDMLSGSIWGGVRGPFTVLVNVPELARSFEPLARHIRFECTLPEFVREMAVLIVARHFRADQEWVTHVDHARAAGIDEETIAAIGEGLRPELKADRDRIIYDYCRSVLSPGDPDSEVYGRAEKLFGPERLVELTTFIGFYSMTAMLLTSFHVIPKEGRAPWR